MPRGRYHPRSPFWALGSGAEIIMPLPTCDETLSIDVLTVTVPGSLIATVLTLPFLAIVSSTEGIAAAALLAAYLKTVTGTQVSYQRIRRRITGGPQSPFPTGH